MKHMKLPLYFTNKSWVFRAMPVIKADGTLAQGLHTWKPGIGTCIVLVELELHFQMLKVHIKWDGICGHTDTWYKYEANLAVLLSLLHLHRPHLKWHSITHDSKSLKRARFVSRVIGRCNICSAVGWRKGRVRLAGRFSIPRFQCHCDNENFIFELKIWLRERSWCHNVMTMW